MIAPPDSRKRLAALAALARPLLLLFMGMVLLSLGAAYLFIEAYQSTPLPAFVYYLTLQFLSQRMRAVLFFLLGLAVLGAGLWRLGGLAVIQINNAAMPEGGLVVGYRADGHPPRVVAISGGAGLLILAGLGEHLQQLTGIIPLQDAVEYYYRASSLFSFRNVYYVVPTPVPLQVVAELSDDTRLNVMQIVHNEQFAQEYVRRLTLLSANDGLPGEVPLSRMALDAIRQADVIILGPGSLFESVLPNLLLPEISRAIRESQARVIFVCNLMTEPGLTTGFDVGDHVREVKRYGGFTPDYVLVNAQRIEPEIRQMYEAANYAPVFLDPEAYEETAVLPADQGRQKQVLVEGAVVVEADLASAMIQLTATLDNPGQNRAVRVLRHDPEKLRTAILALLQRG